MTTHGMSKTSEFIIWVNIIDRCNRKKNKKYDRYGGRGIKICERWSTFLNFLMDMGQRPSKGHSIDRIDPDGNYEPGNCRWATKSEQNRNKGKLQGTSSKHIGVCWNKKSKRWASSISVNGKQNHLGFFKEESAAASAYQSARAKIEAMCKEKK